MSKLGAVVEALEKQGRFVLEQVKRARRDEKFAQAMTDRWNKIKAETPVATPVQGEIAAGLARSVHWPAWDGCPSYAPRCSGTAQTPRRARAAPS